MTKNIVIISLLTLVVGLPFLFRNKEEVAAPGTASVIIVTPHNESIRHEFGRGFREWYREKTGKDVVVDWRVLGGTSEIARYLQGEYTAAFRSHWTNDLGNKWNTEVQVSFADLSQVFDNTPNDDTVKERARRAFLESEISCGIDVFFGGGNYDHNRQAQIGNTVASKLFETHPDWFGEGGIPELLSGERYWDPEGRWMGSVLSSYGMIYNLDSLNRLGIDEPPQHWWDLEDPRLFGEVAVCDPTKSGSITQAFEMIIQQQIQIRLAEFKSAGHSPEEAEALAVRVGWESGLRLIRRISGNAQYFTDSSMKPSIDVSLGQAAVGMTIDFYGKFQVESVDSRAALHRLGFVTPKGGSTISADPISLLRGAPNKELGEAFLEFVMSLEGQKLWSFKANPQQEGAPHRFSLRRTAIRPDIYSPANMPLMSDPDYQPFERASEFSYHAEWTNPLFSEIRFLIRVMCLDLHPELKEAWAALLENKFPAEATRVFDDMSLISYDAVFEKYAPTIGSGNPEAEVVLARELGTLFRNQYKEVLRLAHN
ncbi:MAG: ABC transporter substrate-binding protein [Verrucomicrobia bacterium]|nr:ABC transporter substrate-binding protein [Verrucomicrobiota bacterium]MDA1068137.1 ABC transporter substrate-binding protein [Verrucomicrobiota bacterium]